MSEVEFWQSRYVSGRTPWDAGGVPAALTRWLARSTRTGRVLIPGCGSGYELKAFHDAGWDVVALDYTPAAVERARRSLGALGDRVLLADFFTHDFGPTRFEVVYERTFLCAIPPNRWPRYVERMRELLVADGRLVGFFLFGKEDNPPPYPLTREIQKNLFENDFRLKADEEVPDSLPLFAGRERWQVWAKTPPTAANVDRGLSRFARKHRRAARPHSGRDTQPAVHYE